MPTWLSSPLFAAGLLVSLVGNLGLGIYAWVEASDAATQHERIEDPKTGFIAQLATANANAETAKTGLERCTAASKATAATGQTKIAEAQDALKKNTAELARIAARLAAAANFQSTGETCPSVEKLFQERVRP